MGYTITDFNSDALRVSVHIPGIPGPLHRNSGFLLRRLGINRHDDNCHGAQYSVDYWAVLFAGRQLNNDTTNENRNDAGGRLSKPILNFILFLFTII